MRRSGARYEGVSEQPLRARSLWRTWIVARDTRTFFFTESPVGRPNCSLEVEQPVGELHGFDRRVLP